MMNILGYVPRAQGIEQSLIFILFANALEMDRQETTQEGGGDGARKRLARPHPSPVFLSQQRYIDAALYTIESLPFSQATILRRMLGIPWFVLL